MCPDDIAFGLQLCRLAGWNQLAEDWRVFLGSSNCGGLVARRRGTVAFLRYGGFSWLSMMLVDPDARRSGIGTSLIEAALDALSAEPCVRLDATPAGQPLYRKFGFAGEYELVRATIAIAEGSATISGDVRPMQAEDLPTVFARDRQVFGGDRSELLNSFYYRAPKFARIVRHAGSVIGYSFGRTGYLYPQLGPLVANNAGVARDIVTACLADQPGQTVAMDVPLPDSNWIAWLESLGFHLQRPFLRMYRGTPPPLTDSASHFAIAGPEFG